MNEAIRSTVKLRQTDESINEHIVFYSLGRLQLQAIDLFVTWMHVNWLAQLVYMVSLNLFWSLEFRGGVRETLSYVRISDATPSTR